MARITRVSILKVLVPPTCSNSRSCSTRSSLTCMAGLAVETSSRKMVPPSACMNLPILSPVGAGEGAGHVAEQLALQQRFRQGAAGDLDEGPVAPAAAAVDGPGDHRLAGAALAGDEHGGAGVGDAVDHVVDLQHAAVVADDVFHAEAEIELRLQARGSLR